MTEIDEKPRQTVWLALADLYLDTELDEQDWQRLAAVCQSSGFSWAEIKEINYQEVAPALLFNLREIAGVWAGWNEKWLLGRISSRLGAVPPRSFGSKRLWRWQVDFYTKRPLARLAACLR